MDSVERGGGLKRVNTPNYKRQRIAIAQQQQQASISSVQRLNQNQGAGQKQQVESEQCFHSLQENFSDFHSDCVTENTDR
jgi:hypothetical protein